VLDGVTNSSSGAGCTLRVKGAIHAQR